MRVGWGVLGVGKVYFFDFLSSSFPPPPVFPDGLYTGPVYVLVLPGGVTGSPVHSVPLLAQPDRSVSNVLVSSTGRVLPSTIGRDRLSWSVVMVVNGVEDQKVLSDFWVEKIQSINRGLI